MAKEADILVADTAFLARTSAVSTFSMYYVGSMDIFCVKRCQMKAFLSVMQSANRPETFCNDCCLSH